jgi:hypothetical protein
MLNVVMFCVIILSVKMLNVVMLCVVMLSVVAPPKRETEKINFFAIVLKNTER